MREQDKAEFVRLVNVLHATIVKGGHASCNDIATLRTLLNNQPFHSPVGQVDLTDYVAAPDA